jgi:hypothetical protein
MVVDMIDSIHSLVVNNLQAKHSWCFFIHDAGILQLLISDNSGEQTFRHFWTLGKNLYTQYHIDRKYTIIPQSHHEGNESWHSASDATQKISKMQMILL